MTAPTPSPEEFADDLYRRFLPDECNAFVNALASAIAARDAALLAALRAEVERLKKRIASQRNALADKDATIKRRTTALDAMAWVWCDGGCPGGVFRQHEELRPLTYELVQTALLGVERMCRKYGSTVEFPQASERVRKECYGSYAAACAANAAKRVAESRAERAEAEIARLRETLEQAHRYATGQAFRILTDALAEGQT